MNIGQFGEAFIPIYDGVGRVMKAYADTTHVLHCSTHEILI